MYIPNNRAAKYIKEKLIKLIEKIDKDTLQLAMSKPECHVLSFIKNSEK